LHVSSFLDCWGYKLNVCVFVASRMSPSSAAVAVLLLLIAGSLPHAALAQLTSGACPCIIDHDDDADADADDGDDDDADADDVADDADDDDADADDDDALDDDDDDDLHVSNPKIRCVYRPNCEYGPSTVLYPESVGAMQ